MPAQSNPPRPAGCPLGQSWRGIGFNRAWAEASHPRQCCASRLTMKIACICLLVFHMARFDHNISICFTNICEATSDFTQSPRESPCVQPPPWRSQIHYNGWFFNIQGSPPSWLGPHCAETRSDPGLSATLGKWQTLSLPVWEERPKVSPGEGKKSPPPAYGVLCFPPTDMTEVPGVGHMYIHSHLHFYSSFHLTSQQSEVPSR